MSKPTCAAIIIGIEGWQNFTLPLIQSINRHEPDCLVVVVDNDSREPYPTHRYGNDIGAQCNNIRIKRSCYSRAINIGKETFGTHEIYPDWYVVLSNDVLCTGPFGHLLAQLPPCVAGPQLWHEHGLDWIVGWCLAIPSEVWNAVGGFDEEFIYSSWDDVDMSVSALEKGYPLIHVPALPFVHLDQRQRFGLPGYAGSEAANMAYFAQKHGMTVGA